MLWPVLTWVSVTLHGLFFGAPHMQLCARAWWLRHHRFWRVWVLIWDVLLWPVEGAHCRRCYDRRWLTPPQ